MIPSLLQIPSAVSDSKLHSVLPNNGKGDFTFDRSTGATRINKDGLIEEVGYFSSELVQNGDFSELGSELITNGDFATNSDWTLGTGWSINNGYAVAISGGSSKLTQTISGLSGKNCKVTFTLSDYGGSGSVRVDFGSVTSDPINTNGEHTVYGTYDINAFELFKNSAFSGKIDNVSVKQVDPNDRWFSLGTGWSFGDGVVSSDGSQSTNSDCTQNMTTDAGKTYKITYTISEYSAGGVFIRLASGNVTTTQTSAGTFSENLSAIGGTQIRIRANSTFVGTISNISVVEVQGDRPRLSYDITNGVVEDQPHLLLEPSSSNVVVNSKQTNTWTYTEFGSGSAGTITTSFTDMMGETNAIKVDYPANADNAVVRFGSTTDSLTSGTATYSMYIKLVEAGSKVLQIRASTGILQTITVNSTEFKRYSVTGTKNSNEAISLIVRPAQGTSSGGFSVVVCCPQGEAQSYATSYIPTAGTTITRAAETCNNSKPSVNSTEGVFYLEVAALANDLTARYIAINDGSSVNRVRLGYNASVSNRFRALVVSGGSITADLNDVDTTLSDITQYNKIAFKYKANDFALYFNGTEVKTDTSGAVPTGMNQLDFHNGAGTNDFYGKVKGLAVYNEALSESQLFQLTGVTASSIYSNFVTRTASFTVEALNEVKKVIDNL